MNYLKNEKSPYLLQHKDNPVNWYPWCGEAFEKAEKEDKPVFLSIGYSTCHWCHVMAHESFEDEEVASVLNRDYVCIKVDREERPDIDAIYMTVCQIMTGSGGWPLTIFMTPGQKPFFAGTYFPKKQRYGHAGLLNLLEKISELWKFNRSEILDAGSRITEYLNKKDISVSGEPEKSLLKASVRIFEEQFDSEWGGFGSAPKFPVPHNFLFLMKYALLEKENRAMDMAEYTLKTMALGGIHDQIGGGFSRYSTDAKWLVPHFEKMLYDNALLASSYLMAFHITGKPFYEDVARRTLDYVLRELTGSQGEFFCGQDADSDGTEGKYYVFTPEEIRQILGQTDSDEFCHIYDITEKGNFEGKSIPNRIRMSGRNEQELMMTGWSSQDIRLKKLYDYRLKRTSLHKDDKVILSWNGWMMIAMADAGRILGDDRYLQAAIRTAKFIRENMQDSDRRFFHRWREGEAAHVGQLDDYAVYGLAMLSIYRATLEPFYLEEAVFRARQMADFFEDKKDGGYYLTASYGETLITRPKETYDGAVPSGNSAAAVLLAALSAYTGETQIQEAADRQIRFLSGMIRDYPAGHSMSLLALTEVLYPTKTLICTSSGETVPDELKNYLQKHAVPNLAVILKTRNNQEDIEKILPFIKDYPLPENGSVFYLCKNGMCMAPVKELEQLIKDIEF